MHFLHLAGRYPVLLEFLFLSGLSKFIFFMDSGISSSGIFILTGCSSCFSVFSAALSSFSASTFSAGSAASRVSSDSSISVFSPGSRFFRTALDFLFGNLLDHFFHIAENRLSWILRRMDHCILPAQVPEHSHQSHQKKCL